MGVVFGTAPDSWGVWFAEHESQPPWDRFLDEVQAAGYSYIELGPYGYLPTDTGRLGDELARRGLALLAGTLIADLHVAGRRDQLREEVHAIGRLVAPLGAKFLVLIANSYRPDGLSDLGPGEWKELVATTDELGRVVRDEYGLTLCFHPHADTVVEYAAQVDRFLDDTDPSAVHLCLDTGHLEYRDGDSVALMRSSHERVPYLHLKSVDGALREQLAADGTDFATAVGLGVMCEPDAGVVDFPALDAVLRSVGWDGWAVVEQDMFPLTDLSLPLAVAVRTREYFTRLGWRCRT
jgi:inosose dehydratase